MNFFPLLLFQCWGVGGGFLRVEEMGVAPILSAHYLVEIRENLLIHESVGHWQKHYEEIEGTRSKECEFSGLSFNETLLFRLNKWKRCNLKGCDLNMSIGAGPGMGIHLLKNCVKDRMESGGWIITEYYALNANTIGFHISMVAEVGFKKFSISALVRSGIILINQEGENLFYTNGDIRETSCSICLSFLKPQSSQR